MTERPADRLSPRNDVRRDGETVLRPSRAWTPAVHALLRHLEHVGFTGSPSSLGSGSSDEAVAYIEGDVDGKRVWSDDGMHELGRLMRRLHDATATFRPPDGAVWQAVFLEGRRSDVILSHRDAAPWNVVARDGLPVGLIDWERAGPVDRLTELAHTGWLNAQLHDDAIAAEQGFPSIGRRARQLRAFADGYSLAAPQRAELVTRMIEVAVLSCAADVMAAEIAHDSVGKPGELWGVAWRARSAAWLVRNRDLLEGALR